MSNNLFGLTFDTELENQEVTDSIGFDSPRNVVLESGIYKGIIKRAYFTKSNTANSKAVALNVEFDVEANNNTNQITQQYWICNAKGENWYVDKSTNKKSLLLGFNKANELFWVLGKSKKVGLAQILDPVNKATKTIHIEKYDFETKTVQQVETESIPLLEGKQLALAIKKIVTNRQKYNSSTGTYEPINEKREYNEVQKVFDINTLRSYSELIANTDKPVLATQWKEAHTGVTKDTFKQVNEVESSQPTLSSSDTDLSKLFD